MKAKYLISSFKFLPAMLRIALQAGQRSVNANLPANLPGRMAHLFGYYMRYQTRRRAYELLSAAIVALAGFFLIAILVDRFVELPRLLRLVLPLLAAVVPALLVLWTLCVCIRRRNPDRAASELDRAMPRSRDVLRSSLNFCGREILTPHGIAPYFLTATLQKAEAIGAQADPVRILGYGKTPRRLILMFGLVAIAIALTGWPFMRMSLLLERFLDPLGNHPRPSLTVIDIAAPLFQSISQGDDLEIKVQLTGHVPKDSQCMLYVDDQGKRQEILMTPRPMARFSAVLREVNRPLVFHVTAGDGRSAFHRVEVKPCPKIQKLHVRYDYPRYTRLKAEREELKGRELKGFEGTRVTVDFDSSLAIRESEVAFPEISYRIRWDKQRRHGSFRFTIDKESSFSIRLKADIGTSNYRELPYHVRVIPDNPPVITVIGFPDPPVVFREDILDLKYVCSDDFGIENVMVRARRQSDREPYEVSVPPSKGDPRKIEGAIGLVLADVIDETDNQVRVELVAMDTKGQETTTVRFDLTVISETPERLLAELATIEEAYLKDSLRGTTEILQAQAVRLGILLEAMDESMALDGKRKEMAESILRNLRGVRIQECDPRLYVTEYPGMSQKRAEYLMSMPLALLQHGYYERQLTALLAQRKPYPALVTLKPILEQQAKIAKDILDATEDLLKETQLRLVDCLAEGLINQISVITNADRSEDYLEQLHQKQAQSLETMLPLLVGVKEPDLEQAATALQESMQTAQEGRDQAIRAGLEGVRTALAAGGYLDGRLAVRLESLRQKRPLAEWLRLAQVGDEQSAGLLNAFGVYLALQRGNLEPNDAELFFCATAYEALLTGDPARIAAATQRIAAHSGGALRYELLERLRQFRLLLHEMRVSLAVGRLRADDVRIESPWQEVRESILAIMTDRQAGRFKPLGPEIEARLEKLRKLQPAFLPWSGRTALRNKAFPALANEAEKICVETIAALEPAVMTEVKAILSETNMVLPNVAFNIQKETERLQTDRKELALEVKKGIVERKAKENTPEEQKVKWRHAAPDRLLFSDRLIQRIAVHSIVFEKLLDFREWLWIRNPAAASLADLCPAAILAEYLKLLEQETYRKAVMGHQTSNYPYQLEIVALYYETLIPVFASLHKWATRLGVGGAPTLMDDKAFVASLARFKQPNQYGAMKKAWDSHIQFHAACAAANDPAAKDRLLLSLQSCEVPSAFWDRLVFATETIRLLAAQIYSESQKPAWTGIQPAQETAATAAIGRIKKLLPDPKSMPDQAQLLMEALTDWPRIAGQIAPKKLASLPPPRRQELGQNIGDWLESFSKARDNLAELVAAPVTRIPRTKFRTHALMFRFDVLGRMERSENQWLARISRTTRGMWSQRAQAVASDGSGVSAITAADADWSASYEQRVRRKSTAAGASRIRSGGTGTEAADYGSLKMPVYLYEALVGAAKCPYPNQFKNPGTRYIQRLLQEAR